MQRDLRIVGRISRTGRMAVTKPDAKYVRGDCEISAWQVQRRSDLDGVIQPLVTAFAADGGGNLPRGLNGRERPLIALSVVAISGCLCGLARCAGVGQPAMFGVGDDDGSVVELDLEAGPTAHNAGGGEYAGWLAVSAKKIVTDLDLTHRGPATGSRQRRVEGKRLPDGRPRRDDDHLRAVHAGRQP